MKPFCEIVALEILPAVRAMVARQLIENHGISQTQAAELLGISQPAVSQYKRDLRGFKSEIFKKNPGLQKYVDGIAEKLATGQIKDYQSTISFCELCKEIRFSGYSCEIHKSRDPSLGTCSVCSENKDFYGKPGKKSFKGKIKILSKF